MNILVKNEVAIYCSKPSKVEIPLDEQIKRLKKYCKHFGLDIVKEYIDTDNVKKPQFNKMIEDIKTKAFNIVLSYNLETLSKNDDDLYKLIGELYKYNYELQLENSYIYAPVIKPLIKRERNDNIKKEKKEKAKCYPKFNIFEVKNPKSTTPYNWVNLLGEDTSRFEENPIFDDNGNCLGTYRDVFVIMKEIVGFGRIKMREQEKAKIKVKPRKLFDTYSDIVEKEKKENERRKFENSNLL